jgi:hypothetical protein
MAKILTRTLMLAALALLVAACGETAVVDSGTYEGTITEVNADEREIYVQVPETGTLELYFTDETELVRDGEAAPFDALARDQRVSVQVERVGQRLDPVTVRILE